MKCVDFSKFCSPCLETVLSDGVLNGLGAFDDAHLDLLVVGFLPVQAGEHHQRLLEHQQTVQRLCLDNLSQQVVRLQLKSEYCKERLTNITPNADLECLI